VWICVHDKFGSFLWICVCVFFWCMFLLMNMFVWIDVHGSGCVVRLGNTFVWIGVHHMLGSFLCIRVCVFFGDIFPLMNMFVWIGLHGSVNLDHLLRFRFCGFVCVDRCVWIGVREVFRSIFVDLCMCIFWVYVSVDEYVCVDRFVWICEYGSVCVK